MNLWASFAAGAVGGAAWFVACRGRPGWLSPKTKSPAVPAHNERITVVTFDVIASLGSLPVTVRARALDYFDAPPDDDGCFVASVDNPLTGPLVRPRLNVPLEAEGIVWCRGWKSDDAKALLAAYTLSGIAPEKTP